MAYTRLENLEKSLKRKGEHVALEYNKIITDYIDKDYIQQVPLKSEEQWFLPHFPVVRADKTTTKVRVVFDAAATSNGKCLNDAILPGPKLLREINDVLLRFRRAPVALSADITQMFLQVKLKEQDRRYHRFLWRNLQDDQPPSAYEFLRLPFGNTASPFCAQYVLYSHARSAAHTYPEAAETVENSMYVDDVLDSKETIQDAVALRRQLSEMLSGAGFTLRKWLSNEAEVIQDVPDDERSPGVDIPDGNLPSQKTLGVLWKAKDDVFSFNVEKLEKPELMTKRAVLSKIATIFDPLQLLSPFTVRAKIIMQEIWTAGIGWDEHLPDDLSAKWKAWSDELTDLSLFEVPRCLRLPTPSDTQLHVFSDASKDAYSAVAYLLCKYEDRDHTCRLIASKNRVSPIKAVTIPRLELMGAVLSARLATAILKVLTVHATVFWTDSTNVLFWVHNRSRNFKPFVANRVGEIQRLTNPEDWRHVPGDKNPADLPTRGFTASQLNNNQTWKEGPTFLLDDESSWPVNPATVDPRGAATDEERRKTTHVTEATIPNTTAVGRLDLHRYSQLRKLLRVTAWFLRFIKNCKLKDHKQRTRSAALSPEELKQSEIFWIGQAQYSLEK
jgi:hypothetical protein